MDIIKSICETQLMSQILLNEDREKIAIKNWKKDDLEIIEKTLEKLRRMREDFDDSEKFSPERLSEQLLKTIVSRKYLYIDNKEFNRAVALPENMKIIGLWLYENMPGICLDIEVPDDEEGTKKISIPVYRLMNNKSPVLDENKEYFLGYCSPFSYAVFFDDLYNNTY